MMGLCPLHNAFYMLTLYADAHLQQFLINCSGFPPDYIKLTFLVKPRLVILFQKSITVLHISVNVHIFFDNFLKISTFFSTKFQYRHFVQNICTFIVYSVSTVLFVSNPIRLYRFQPAIIPF